ncbi:uncharacterized protein Pyn_39827 [Prunus yedoensis var. nudiflora]|uniref:Glycosyl hydrolase family 32 N-terminal domain-containing protein n=1 Tax=Prunus yedoensis var. nudiflora TaxID=2094558 RepID=A0A314UCT6_PRUYE|nr:uncharacterized protein Pyn_39827 [Prunus yedoensis var. nudiflora]
MWYYGKSSSNPNPGLDSIGLAVSSNGVHWERGVGQVQSSQDVGAVINCGKDWWAFDTQSIRPSEVVVMSSSKVRASSAVYWLYYTGYSAEEADNISNQSQEINLENPKRFLLDGLISDKNGGIGKIFKSLPGLAISQDGRHWARIEGEHHSGALFDVGLQGEWDSSFIAAPHVVFHESGDLRMYYHSFDLEMGNYSIGMARSRDGIKWVKLGKIIGGGRSGYFDELGAMNPCVVRNRKDGEYLMAYEGVGGDGGRSIGLAVSPDGLKDWTRLKDDDVVLKASEDCGWDNKGLDLHVWFRWMGKKMSGGCIIEVLGLREGLGLEWQFHKVVMLQSLRDAQDFICNIYVHCHICVTINVGSDGINCLLIWVCVQI